MASRNGSLLNSSRAPCLCRTAALPVGKGQRVLRYLRVYQSLQTQIMPHSPRSYLFEQARQPQALPNEAPQNPPLRVLPTYALTEEVLLTLAGASDTSC